MSKVSKHILPTMRENPPIPFVTKLKKLEAEGADSEKVDLLLHDKISKLVDKPESLGKDTSYITLTTFTVLILN
jgi:hypothetical protein